MNRAKHWGFNSQEDYDTFVRKWGNSCINSSPFRKYAYQKRDAGYRNIKWELSFQSWWKIWQDSGKWEQRGKKRDNYVMARKDDIGPYSQENVSIVPQLDNRSEYLDRRYSSPSRITDDLLKKILSMKKAGVLIKEIAYLCGRTEATISQICYGKQYEPRRKQFSV